MQYSYKRYHSPKDETYFCPMHEFMLKETKHTHSFSHIRNLCPSQFHHKQSQFQNINLSSEKPIHSPTTTLTSPSTPSRSPCPPVDLLRVQILRVVRVAPESGERSGSAGARERAGSAAVRGRHRRAGRARPHQRGRLVNAGPPPQVLLHYF